MEQQTFSFLDYMFFIPTITDLFYELGRLTISFSET